MLRKESLPTAALNSACYTWQRSVGDDQRLHLWLREADGRVRELFLADLGFYLIRFFRYGLLRVLCEYRRLLPDLLVRASVALFYLDQSFALDVGSYQAGS